MRLLLRGFGWLVGLIGLFLLIAFGILYAFVPELPIWAKVLGGVGPALIALSIFMDWGNLQNLGKDRTVLRSMNATFGILLVLGICIAANVLAHRYDKRWDLTAGKQYTLSQQSIDIVSKLAGDVEVLAFFQSGSPDETKFRDLMERYLEHTTLLKVEYHDPNADPVLAQQEKLVSMSTVILKFNGATQRLENTFDEEAVTNALVKLTSEKEHTVCFVAGHDELALDDDQGPNGLGISKIRLKGQNYKTSTISLLSTPPTPDTCEVVVVAGPRTELLPGERDRLAQYVAAGGGLIAMLDPAFTPDFAADMSRYGVKVGNDAVNEDDPYRRASAANRVDFYVDPAGYDIHPITAKLKGAVRMALVRSVGKGAEIAGLNVQELVHSSETSWAETSLDQPMDTWQPDPGADTVGKISLVTAVEVTDPAAIRTTSALPAMGAAALPANTAPPAAPAADASAAPTADASAAPAPAAAAPEAPTNPLPTKAGGHVVVYGDADFASNQLVTVGTNQDLFLNAVAWMVGEEDQISIRPNEAGKGKLTLDLLSLVVSALVVLATPAVAILGAVGTWLARRRL